MSEVCAEESNVFQRVERLHTILVLAHNCVFVPSPLPVLSLARFTRCAHDTSPLSSRLALCFIFQLHIFTHARRTPVPCIALRIREHRSDTPVSVKCSSRSPLWINSGSTLDYESCEDSNIRSSAAPLMICLSLE